MNQRPSWTPSNSYSQQINIVNAYLDLPLSSSFPENHPHLPPSHNFIRDKCKDITKYLKETMKVNQNVSSWVQFAKLLFKFRYKYQNADQWSDLRNKVEELLQTNQSDSLYVPLYHKVSIVVEMVEDSNVRQVINLIEQNEKKRKKLQKLFLNQARRQRLRVQ